MIFSQGLFFPIGKTALQPFQGAEAKIILPDMTPNDLNQPYCCSMNIQLKSFNLPKITEANAGKKHETNRRLHQVINECQ
jgi:hypothetical protein